MDIIIAKVTQHLSAVNWEGPAIFVLAILAVFALMRKWSLILLILLIVAIGWGAEDLIVFNLSKKSNVISVPLMIYIVGGVVVFVLALISFFRAK
jgi:hypothetical protein